MEVIISPYPEELTLRRFLKLRYPVLPDGMLTRALRQRDIKRDGKRLYPNSVVRKGDELAVYIDSQYLHPELPIAYKDENLLALIKLRGVPSVGEGSIEDEARHTFPTATACHRLDTQTGGLLLFSLNADANARLLDAFKHRNIQKKYRCTVLGRPSSDTALLKAYLRKDAAAGFVEIFDLPVRDSLPIETGYRVLSSDEETSELSVDLITGRTHQIRAQMAHIGHPVLGDDRYGNREANRRLGIRLMRLWASALTVGELHICSVPPWEGNTDENTRYADNEDG